MPFTRKEVLPKFWVDFYNNLDSIFKPIPRTLRGGGSDEDTVECIAIGRSYTMFVGAAVVQGIVSYDNNREPETFEIHIKLRTDFSVLIRLRMEYFHTDSLVVSSERYRCNPKPDAAVIVFYSQEYTDEEIEQMLTTELLLSR